MVFAIFLVAGSLLVGCPSSDEGPKGIPGATTGTERWVVTFQATPQGKKDLEAYRAALKKSPQAARASAAEARKNAIEARRSIDGALKSFGARIVDHWWMTNSITVEIPAGNAASLRALPGVVSAKPDALLPAN